MEESTSNGGVTPIEQNHKLAVRSQGSFEQGHARRYFVPDTTLVSIEHPYIIKNADRGIRSLGGIEEVVKLLDARKSAGEGELPSARLHLHPDDAMAKPIMSKVTPTSNVLLRVTVPKRTGRKRKRGSSEPFQDSTQAINMVTNGHVGGSNWIKGSNPSELLQRLCDNSEVAKIEAVGTIVDTHRFRAMPDFAYSTSSSPLMKKLYENILPFEYQNIKGFELDLRRDAVDMIPPPSFSQMTIPFNYLYHQNPAVKLITDEAGRLSTSNPQTAPRLLTQVLSTDDPVIPTGPVPEALPEQDLGKTLRTLVTQLRDLIEKRPIMTRRYILNKISREHEYQLKSALQYVGYTFRSGPWREAIVKYGIDPRTDPKYRMYQTMTFKLAVKLRNNEPTGWEDQRGIYRRATIGKELDRESHLFDGKKLVQDGKTWQICDIIEPTLKKLLATQNLRTECETKVDGWYHNGTSAIIRVFMRDMIHTILGGNVPNPADYHRLAQLPEIIDKSTLHLTQFGRWKQGSTTNVTDKEVRMSNEIRYMAKAQAPDLVGLEKESSAGQIDMDKDDGDEDVEEQSDRDFEDADEDLIDSVEIDEGLENAATALRDESAEVTMGDGEDVY